MTNLYWKINPKLESDWLFLWLQYTYAWGQKSRNVFQVPEQLDEDWEKRSMQLSPAERPKHTTYLTTDGWRESVVLSSAKCLETSHEQETPEPVDLRGEKDETLRE